MGRKIKSLTLVFLMLTSVLLISVPVDATTEENSVIEPKCNANRNSTWSVGLIYCDDQVNTGYTLFSPMSSTITYLIDIHGREIHSWISPGGHRPGLSSYLLEDGDLLRTANLGQNAPGSFSGGGAAGKVERISWDGTLEWSWTYSTNQVRSHHDIEPLPNGNFLMIAWESKTEAEAIQAGRDPNSLSQSSLWPDHIIEVQPVGSNQANIVWEWHVWDHLIQDHDSSKENYGVVAEHPELLDINFQDNSGPQSGRSDWMHCNGIDYNAALDHIVFSCKNMNEIYIIDHSTTTIEAAGHTGGQSGKGGDFLYRWGNPESYRAGNLYDQKLFGQHDIQWIEEDRVGAGQLILFNNGVGRTPEYSSIDVFSPPFNPVSGEYTLESGLAWGPTATSWDWDIGGEMYGTSISGVERLPNGNTLVTFGPKGTFYEVNLDGEIVWEYVNPVVGSGPMNQGDTVPQGNQPESSQNNVFKVRRYSSVFPGLVDKDLTPYDYIESWTDACNKEESIPWDSDGDGCIDDSDGDGIYDNADICDGFDDTIDIDLDGIPDGCDQLIDSDEDGVSDSSDICPGYDDTIDIDLDGIPDGCDQLIDSDEDGISDAMDSCEGYNDSSDIDLDGIPDGCDSTPLGENQDVGNNSSPSNNSDNGSSIVFENENSDSNDSKMTIAVIFSIIGLFLIFISASYFFLTNIRNQNQVWGPAPVDPFDYSKVHQIPDYDPPAQVLEPTPVQPALEVRATVSPPLPPTGLPEGWTLEQWEHYGQQYLDRTNSLN